MKDQLMPTLQQQVAVHVSFPVTVVASVLSGRSWL